MVQREGGLQAAVRGDGLEEQDFGLETEPTSGNEVRGWLPAREAR